MLIKKWIKNKHLIKWKSFFLNHIQKNLVMDSIKNKNISNQKSFQPTFNRIWGQQKLLKIPFYRFFCEKIVFIYISLCLISSHLQKLYKHQSLLSFVLLSFYDVSSKHFYHRVTYTLMAPPDVEIMDSNRKL